MDATTSLLVLDKIQSRLNECQILNKVDFDLINNGGVSKLDSVELRDFVTILFKEHIAVKSLINDVYDLLSALSKFDL